MLLIIFFSALFNSNHDHRRPTWNHGECAWNCDLHPCYCLPLYHCQPEEVNNTSGNTLIAFNNKISWFFFSGIWKEIVVCC
uniref:Secreted protein n=1 Tax=Panagrolaimus sp. JU765 TaxID=591449 RepID=A0AC34RPV9_9BILA